MRSLRDAVEAWTDLDAPYEAARARMALAEALAAGGQPDRAAMELSAARAAFEQLGAVLELRRADEIGASMGIGPEATAASKAAPREVRAFAFTDIVDSTRMGEALGDDGLARRPAPARRDGAIRRRRARR